MLATNPSTATEQLTDILNAANHISVWVDTLQNAALPSMSPQPAWYAAVNDALAASRQHSQTWRKQTAPDIITDMTESFIDYSVAFGTTVDYVRPILSDIATAGFIPSAPQITVLTQLFGALQTTTTQNQATVQRLLAAVKSYRDEMTSDYAALQRALKAALPQAAAERAAIQQIQTQIESIEIALAADGQAASAATVDTGSAMTSLVIGLTFASEFDPVAFGIGLIFIGVDSAVDAETEARVISDLEQIQSLTRELTNDQVQLGLLQGVIANLERLSQGIESALAAFDDFDDTWTIANLSLTYLLVALAQPQVDIRRIPDLNNLQDAVAAWATMSAYASKVQSSVLTSRAPMVISSVPNAVSTAN